MNKTNYLIDITLLAAFLIAMEPRFGGIAVHEWLSLALAAIIVLHLLLHWDWIVAVGLSFFRKLWQRSRLKFVVDLLLFAAFVAVMLSGVLISKVALPQLALQAGYRRLWRELHAWSADASLLLLGLHFALNWGWLWCMTQRYILNPIAGVFSPGRAQPAAVCSSEDGGSGEEMPC